VAPFGPLAEKDTCPACFRSSGAALWLPLTAGRPASCRYFGVRIRWSSPGRASCGAMGIRTQTSCMPSSGNPSTEVCSRRSPSRRVHPRPPASRHVAVLSCCTIRYPHPHEPSTRTPTTRTAYRRHLVIEADRPKRARRHGGKSDELDAVRAARQALTSPDPARPRAGNAREALRILLATRRARHQDPHRHGEHPRGADPHRARGTARPVPRPPHRWASPRCPDTSPVPSADTVIWDDQR
jgi:hypothetical protein